MTAHTLRVVPPGYEGSDSGSDVITVTAVTNMHDLFTSPRPEHRAIQGDISRIMSKARTVAEDLGECMHPDIQGPGFWETFHPTFATFSAAPAIATHHALMKVLESVEIDRAVVEEQPRDASWWAGTAHFEPIARSLLASAGVTCTAAPSAPLRWLRSALLPAGARRQGRRELETDLGRLDLDAERPPAGECDILFLGAGAAVADILCQLWEPLTQARGLECRILDTHHDGFTPAAKSRGLQTVDLGAFMPSRAEISSAAWPAWWRHYLEHRHDVGAYAKLPSGVQMAIDERVRMTLIRHVEHWRSISRAMRAALETLRPRVIATFHAYPMTYSSFIAQAREVDIPSVFIQHGVLGRFRLAWPVLDPDLALTWGEFGNDLYSKLCENGTPIHETGNCRYDYLARDSGDVCAQAAELADGHRFMVCLATQPNEANFFSGYSGWWIADIARECEALDAALVIKLHPSDTNIDLYERARRAHPDTVRIVEHGQIGLPDLLKASDLMITRDSTVVIESTILRTPALTVEYTDAAEQFPFAETGAVERVTTPEELPGVLRKLLEDEDHRCRLADRGQALIDLHAGPVDGGATERIADHLAKQVRRESGS